MSGQKSDNFKGNDRFIIQQKLGSGSFGVVYQAYDNERNTIVALKTLNRIIREASAGALFRFKKEFRALADVTHPNLVTLYELISDGEQWFFTMELVQGVHFLEYVYDKPANSINLNNSALNKETFANSKLNIDRLRQSLEQMAIGVAALHEMGKLHCDLKPSNMLVTKEGRVVILDFGLIMELAEEEDENLDFVGTPSYMSPEQGAGLPMSEASDWYSVGVLLYEALTGELPFKGSFSEIARKKLSETPPAPILIAPGTPEDLNRLCIDLLNPTPEQRPGGEEVLHRLGVPLVNLMGKVAKSTAQPLTLSSRTNHLITLKYAFSMIQNGRPALVYVHGTSGMGKSSLISLFIDDLQNLNSDIVILSGRCYEQESVPYKAFDSIIDALCRYLQNLTEDEVEALLPRDLFALARLFPVLQQIKAIANKRGMARLVPDSQELRRRAFAALRELLTKMSNKQPMILFIDDLQWGDMDSGLLLGDLLSAPQPPCLLFIVSYRSEEANTNPLLVGLRSLNINPRIDRHEIVVNKLSLEESRQLATTLLGVYSNDFAAQIETIAQEADGSPYFIDELVRHLLSDNEDMEFYEDDLLADLNLSNEPHTINTTFKKMIAKRVTKLPEAARQLLEVVVVAGQPLSRTGAKLITGLQGEEQGAISHLRAHHLIRQIEIGDQEDLDTYHDRIRETILEQLTPTALQELHLKLGQGLEEMPDIDPERLAVHFSRAQVFNKAAQYAVIAANKASDALAFDRAVRFYKLALELRGNEISDQVTALLIKLGDAFVNAGRCSEGAQAYMMAAAESKNSTEILRLERAAAEQWLISGHVEEGLKVLKIFVGKIGMKVPNSLAGVLFSIMWGRLQVHLRGLKFKERQESEIASEELISIDTCWAASTGLSIASTIKGTDFQTRHLLLALKVGEPFRLVRALAMEVAYCALPGGKAQKRCEKIRQQVEELVERLDDPYARAITDLATAVAAFLFGSWRKTYELTEKADANFLQHCTGVTWELDSSALFMLRALYWLGEIKELALRLPAHVKSAHDRGDLFSTMNLSTRISYIAYLANDEPRRAHEEITATLKRRTQKNYYTQNYFALIGDVEIALYCGEFQAGWQLLESQRSALNKSLFLQIQHFYIETLYVNVRILLALAHSGHNRDQNVKKALSYIAKIEKEKMFWGNGLALLGHASIAQLNGKRDEAISLLVKAEEHFRVTETGLYGVAARSRRGSLMRNDEGRSLLEGVDRWMTKQQIKNPERWVAMLLPGNW